MERFSCQRADRHWWLGQVAFDGVGSMPMARIDTIRVTKQAVVEDELAKRSRNKQLREAVSMSERHAPFASQGSALKLVLCSPCAAVTLHACTDSS